MQTSTKKKEDKDKARMGFFSRLLKVSTPIKPLE